MIELVDNTGTSRNGKGRPWGRSARGVDTICLHQTAVFGGFGATRTSVLRYGSQGALLQRYKAVPYHGIYHKWFGIMVWNNDVTRYTWHGSGANATSVGFAVDGAFPGDYFDADAFCGAFGLFVERGRLQGAPLRYVTPHGMWSKHRLADPGKAIWDAAESMFAELELEPDPRQPKGGGKSIVELKARWAR